MVRTDRLIGFMADGLARGHALLVMAAAVEPARASRVAKLNAAQVERYLRVLGVPAGPPSRERLDRLVRAQLEQVPFENVSKLYYLRSEGRRGMPGIDLHLDGVERFRFGGTCHANNIHFYRLLCALGYRAALCGADMPSGPDVHAAVRVRVDHDEFLVDVGYAAPFYEPLPLDLPREQRLRFGRDCYVVRPKDAEGRTAVELVRDGDRAHGYLLKPAPRAIRHFGRAIRDSFRPAATFMRSLLLVRFLDGRTVTILNRLRIDSWRDDYRLVDLSSLDRVVEEVVSAFDMEEDVVRAAVNGITALDSPYG